MNVALIKYRNYLLGLQKVTRVVEKHFLYPRVQNNGRHRALMPRVGPAPATVRVCKVDLDPVNCLGLVLFLGLQDKLLEDSVIPRNDAVMPAYISHEAKNESEWGI
jgi:hypothetical protein